MTVDMDLAVCVCYSLRYCVCVCVCVNIYVILCMTVYASMHIMIEEMIECEKSERKYRKKGET